MALFPASGGGNMTMRKKSFTDIVVTVISDGTNETFIVGGRGSTVTLNGWTTIATITDSDFIPTTAKRGIATDANGLSKQAEFSNTGAISVYGTSGTYTNPYISIVG